MRCNITNISINNVICGFVGDVNEMVRNVKSQLLLWHLPICTGHTRHLTPTIDRLSGFGDCPGIGIRLDLIARYLRLSPWATVSCMAVKAGPKRVTTVQQASAAQALSRLG